MNQEYLFIGGPADGKRFCVHDGRTRQYIASVPPRKLPSVYDSSDPVDIESMSIVETLYRKLKFGMIGHPCVFVDDSIDPGSVVQMLIDGYNPRK